MGGMSRISAERRELYGLGLGVLLLANLACGAAVVVARASGPDTTPASAPARPAAPAVVADHAAIPAAPVAAQSDCGQGSATAQAVLDGTGTGYVLRVTVANDSNRTVELDRLIVTATYADGVRTFTAVDAAGYRIPTGGAETDFALPGGASAARPVSFGVTDFAFHTAGRPDCAAR